MAPYAQANLCGESPSSFLSRAPSSHRRQSSSYPSVLTRPLEAPAAWARPGLYRPCLLRDKRISRSCPPAVLSRRAVASTTQHWLCLLQPI
jgi:hypothetical protein